MKIFLLALVLVATSACDSEVATTVKDLLSTDTAQGLSMGNMRIVEGKMTFKVGNTSSQSGDVIIIASQNGNDRCTYVTDVQANATHTITAICKTLGQGNVNVKLGWASFYQSESAVAIRIE